jgi:membrane protease YdiL (CAAX protease family)
MAGVPEASHQPPAIDHEPSRAASRVVAFLEVLLCSGFPTQLALGGTYVALGFKVLTPDGGLATGYVVAVSLLDAALVISLVFLFLIAHGERPRDILLGSRGAGSITREAALGVYLVPVAFAVALLVLLLTQRLAPWLHTIERNPLQDMLRSPRDAWLFALVLVVAGGVREEVQRAFILHRFTRWLGGSTVGLVLSSIAFGAGHITQGADAAIATALLGAFWGILYLRRGSAAASMTNHAGFDLLQIAQFLVARRSGLVTSCWWLSWKLVAGG